MRITFLGAADTVTGSCYLVETNQTKLLIECGMFQGSKTIEERNRETFNFTPDEIDAVLLTHAHIDHSGLLPKLVNQGFHGKIYCTEATADLCSIMLPDSAHIQEEDLDWVNRKRRRAAQELLVPLYTPIDVENTLKLFSPVPYHQSIAISSDITVYLYDAGHILGSSFILLTVQEKNKLIRLLFSGDLGNHNQRIIRDPEIPPEADYLILEATYGNRSHKSRSETIAEFRAIVEQTLSAGGNIVIPAFAVERTQDILYELHEMKTQGYTIDIPIFIDSPLAISATDIFKRHEECFDAEMWQKIKSGNSPFDFDNLHFTRSSEESKKINLFDRVIIISSSGMCDAGRIRHHLKHNLWKEQNHIIFVGYQAQGTLGRAIIDGAKTVKIFNEEIAVKAHIHTLGGFSAHADQQELLTWLTTIPQPPKQVLLTHGETTARQALAEKIEQDLKLKTCLPTWKEVIEF